MADYKEIDSHIKTGSFSKLYVLYGDEDYLKLQYRNKLIKALVAEGDSMNYTILEGDGISENAIISAAETMPFFAEHRVILIKDSGYFKKATEDVATYFENICDTSVLIFVESETDKRTKTYKAAEKNGLLCEFTLPDTKMLQTWILGKLKKDGKNMSADAYATFAEMTCESMSNMALEYEKLIAYTGDSNTISRADVEAVCTKQITTKIFELTDAMAAKDSKKVFDLYHDMLSAKEPPMRILYMICRQFRQFLMIGELHAKSKTNGEIASMIKAPEFVVRKSIPMLKKLSGKQIRGLLKDAADYEQMVKSGQLDEQLAVEMIMMRYSS